MTMKTQNLMLPLDEVELSVGESDGWQIKGYATRFGNKNTYGFSIAAGAYADLVSKEARVPMFFNHASWEVPIGKWTELEEDSRGLKVVGVLTEGVSLAADVYAALKAGTVDGLSVSIGLDEKNLVSKDGVTVLTKVSRLHEISVVTNPSDSKARISRVLSADALDEGLEKIMTLRDAEDFLRDMGLSKRQSGWLLSKVKACMTSDTDRDDQLKARNELQAIFDRITKL